MARNNTIQVFEYETLLIDTGGFKRSHYEALDRYNEEHKGKYFTLTSRGVKFCNYVGVIQVGNITIEILPKINKHTSETDKTKWQKVLIDMLNVCRWMRVYTNENASLRIRHNSILEAYLHMFIEECENLLRSGLVKKYRSIENNCTALKGKMIFSKQIQKNYIHPERFYTKHTIYDRDNIFNQILLKAIHIIPKITNNPSLKDRISTLILSFPELNDVKVTEETFGKLSFDRKVEGYQSAIEIAAMIILNFRPDISSGENQILAILFDMNDLWEEYIYRKMLIHKPDLWTIKAQNKQNFWLSSTQDIAKKIKPDIVIENNMGIKIILDTKWKVPKNDIPDDGDLKQMFVYNEYWKSHHSILFYPNDLFLDEPLYHKGSFVKRQHHCGIVKMSVLDKTHTLLNKDIGQMIFQFIKKEYFHEQQHIR